MSDISLQLASIDDLMDEIKSRYDSVIVVVAKEHPHEEESTVYNSFSKGPLHTLLGLLEAYKARELDKYLRWARETFEDEDV